MKTKVISDQSRLANLKMLSIKEAALCCGCSERTIWRLVADGKLRSVRIGRLVRIRVKDIEKYIEEAMV